VWAGASIPHWDEAMALGHLANSGDRPQRPKSARSLSANRRRRPHAVFWPSVQSFFSSTNHSPPLIHGSKPAHGVLLRFVADEGTTRVIMSSHADLGSGSGCDYSLFAFAHEWNSRPISIISWRVSRLLIGPRSAPAVTDQCGRRFQDPITRNARPTGW